MPTLTLNRIAPAPGTHAWPLKVTAVGEGLPSAVFVYQAGEGDAGDTFQCVASVHQLNEIPEKAAMVISENLQIPFYRRADATFACKSAQERERIWADLGYHVKLLVDNIRAVSSSGLIETSISYDL